MFVLAVFRSHFLDLTRNPTFKNRTNIQNMKKITTAVIGNLLLLLVPQQQIFSQIGSFNSVAPGGQISTLVLPPSHTFQRIIKSGDALSLGGVVPNDLDFTGYVPIAGSSRNGYLSISSESSTPAGIAMLSINYNFTTHTWQTTSGGRVDFPTTAFGTNPVSRFCSGTVTPNGTIMVSEETVTTGDGNTDGYDDVGWIIEVNPATRLPIESDATHAGVDKLWAIGRASRENVMIMPDNKTLYTGADAGSSQSYVYKFVATTAGDFSAGQLFVLKTTNALGVGTWEPLANTTQAERNTTVALSTAAGAFSFNGVEDVELSPIDGKVYFTAKGTGRIYRFLDNGSTVSGLEVFVASTTYDVDPGPLVANEPWDLGNDNLAFDGEGNLWVLQDGARGHIWVVGPTHTAATPAVRLFAKTPSGSEPTGISFSPDYKFMFLSFQHPSTGNNTNQMDAAGVNVRWNTHTTIVIGRIEDLGSAATLPVKFTNFSANAISNKQVGLSFSVEDVQDHESFTIERSQNGKDFDEIFKSSDHFQNGARATLTHTDDLTFTAKTLYYRVKQCDINGKCTYSEIRKVMFASDKHVRIFPAPATNVFTLNYTAEASTRINVSIVDAAGTIVMQETKAVRAGENSLPFKIEKLKAGTYSVLIHEGDEKTVGKLIKL